MGNLHDLFLLLLLGAVVGTWMKLARARELAVAAARRHCELHGLQLLDETVGLKAIRLRRVGGQRRLERGYAFDVSVDGDDRQPGRLWMQGRRVTGLSLPAVQWLVGAAMNDEAPLPATQPPAFIDRRQPSIGGNVIPLRRRLPPDH